MSVMRLHLILVVALVCVVYTQTTEALLEETKDFSYGTKPGLSWFQELSASNRALSRKKRYVGLPPGSNVEVKSSPPTVLLKQFFTWSLTFSHEYVPFKLGVERVPLGWAENTFRQVNAYSVDGDYVSLK